MGLAAILRPVKCRANIGIFMTFRRILPSLVFGIAVTASGDSPAFNSQAQDQGVTLGNKMDTEPGVGGTTLLVCDSSSEGQNICNPTFGDTFCTDLKPLLCFLDIQATVPAYLDDAKNWSGGIVASTDDVAGNAFDTIAEAHAYCASIFGKDWRVASFHDGGGGAIRAYDNTGDKPRRFWVDIKTQADATCWSR